MGQASSSNVSTAVSNVASYVSDSTNVSTEQVSQLEQKVDFEDCNVKIKGDFNVNESATLMAKNNQIVKNIQDANIQNDIQQKMLQQAQSEVGFLGIGFADANNSASEFVNSSSTIINALSTSANQYSNVNQSFVCDRSYIEAQNLNIGFSNSADFLSTQTVDNSQTASIINHISQSVEQKASATVQGITGLLLGLLLIIAVIIWAIMKPLSSGAAKVIVAIAMLFLLTGIMVWMYLKESPPFFSVPNDCIRFSEMGIGSDMNVSCVDQKKDHIRLGKPPLKYTYGITPADSKSPNLLQMVISSKSSTSSMGNNAGYTIDVMNTLGNNINTLYANLANEIGVPNIPNPLGYIGTPSGSTGSYYKIPSQYLSSNDTNGGICTPGCIQLAIGGITTVKCENPVDPVQAGLDTTSDATLGIANLNTSDWNDYMNQVGKFPPLTNPNDTIKNRALFARFVLCDMMGTFDDLHIYIDGNEPVREHDSETMSTAKNCQKPDNIYQFIPDTPISSYSQSINSGGLLSGQIGYWNTRTYKFQKFMKKIGVWILGAIVVSIFGYMAYTTYANNKENQDNSPHRLSDAIRTAEDRVSETVNSAESASSK